MEYCKICNKELKNLKALSTHINVFHSTTSKDYYDQFLIKDHEGKCYVCGGETTFRGIGVGYLVNCSTDCRDKNTNIKRDYWLGKKQSDETIIKRVTNTDQKTKEINRKKTMVEKYGTDNPMKLCENKDKVSDKLRGRKQLRTTEWQKNIINSKKNNGTANHSTETKKKITNSINEFYKKNTDREKYLSKSNNVRHLSGWYNGLYFRSSLELSFLIKNNEKKLTTCEIKQYSVRYTTNNKDRTYYPDYTDGMFIYEIKPTKLLNFGSNPIKLNAAKKKFGKVYKIITEQECEYIGKDEIKKLIKCGNVVLTKNSEKIFQKYKY
jgi:hypothetical protein